MINAIINIFLYFVGAFISILIYNFCYAKLNNHQLTFGIKNIILIICSTLLLMLSNTIASVYIKLIINFIFLIVELKLTFKDNIKQIIINYVFLYLIIILIEIALTNIAFYLHLFQNSNSVSSLSYDTVLLTIAIGIVQYILLSINFINNLFKNIIKYFITNPIVKNVIIMIFLTITIFADLNVHNFTNENSIIYIMLLLIIFVGLFIDIIRLQYNKKMLINSNQKLMEYNVNYGKFLDEYKIYKHNINHKLLAMKIHGNTEINSLIDDLLEQESNFTIRNNYLYHIPNGIKGIVVSKLYNKNYDIIITNKLKNDYFSKLSPESFNSISECLGIALDNAIEACEETKNPIMIIDIYENKESLFIKIGNNFRNNIDIDNLGNKYYSTKNRGSGLGLFSIIRNNLVTEKIKIINDIYFIELQIKKARF